MQILKSNERGNVNLGWLNTFHSFSFGEYYNPDRLHWRNLRVLNDDHLAPHTGFPTHPHRDMEIITYVLAGAVGHEDSMGNKYQIKAGETQRMTAGTGVAHSEHNRQSEWLHLLQIWILPAAPKLKPEYEQVNYQEELKTLPLVQIGRSNIDKHHSHHPIPSGQRVPPLKLNAEATIYVAKIKSGDSLSLPKAPREGFHLHLIEGSLETEGQTLSARDAAFGESTLLIKALEAAHFIYFALA